MPTLHDDEFGEIIIKKNSLARSISATVAPSGKLRITIPAHLSPNAAKKLIKSSRGRIRTLLENHQSKHAYLEDSQVGKSHFLIINQGAKTLISQSGTKIIATIAEGDDIKNLNIQSEIRKKIIAALRKEAKSYLPRRLKFLAEKHDFSYEKVRITHASSRWGSCSSSGTISLNIALMNLPFELIDYVLLHELCHTVEMNHSSSFWNLVAKVDPDYKIHRKNINDYTPHI